MPRVTVLIPWIGKVPSWFPQFQERAEVNADLVRFRTWVTGWPVIVQKAKAIGLNLDPNPTDGRKVCDLRPAFGELFPELFKGSEFWGWADMDMVFGKMDTFLTPEVLDSYDIITDNDHLTNGPFTIIRNNASLNSLYMPLSELMCDRKYWNVDEDCFGQGLGFTGFVRAMQPKIGIRTLFMKNVHEHDRGMPTPRLDDEGHLFSGKDGREIFSYHFPKSKGWPL